MSLPGYLAGYEFLEEIAEGIEPNTYRRVSQDDTILVAVSCRIVIVCDEACSETAR